MESWDFAELTNQAVWCLFLLADKRLYVSEFGSRLAFIVTGHLVERQRERRL